MPSFKYDGLRQGQTIKVELTLYADGALSVAGPMDQPDFLIAMMQHGIEAVRHQSLRHRPIAIGVMIPPQDVVVRAPSGLVTALGR